MEPELDDDQIFEESGDDAYVVVSRLDPISKRWNLCFRVAPFEAKATIVQQFLGGGTYRMREFVRDEGGAFVYGQQRQITIEGQPKPLTDYPGSAVVNERPMTERSPVEGPGGNAGPAAAIPGGAGVGINEVMTAGVLRLFDAQNQNQENATKMMDVMIARSLNQPQTDWSKVLVAAAPLITAFVNRPKDPATTPLDTVAMIQQVAEIFKENTSKAGELKEQIAVIDSILGVKQKGLDMLTPDAPPPEDAVDALVRQLPKFMEMMQDEQKMKLRRAGIPVDEIVEGAAASPSAAAPTGPAAFPAQPAGVSAPAANDPAKPEGPMWQLILLSRKDYLLKMAQRNKDPVVLGEFEYEVMPDEAKGAVAEFLSHENAFEQIMTTLPELQQYQAWTAQFFETLHRNFFPDEYADEGEEDEVELHDQEGKVIDGSTEVPGPAPVEVHTKGPDEGRAKPIDGDSVRDGE